MKYELIDKYPNLAEFMRKFKKGDDDLFTYRKFMAAKKKIEDKALAGDEQSHEEMLHLGFYKDPSVKTHYLTKDDLRLFDFYKNV